MGCHICQWFLMDQTWLISKKPWEPEMFSSYTEKLWEKDLILSCSHLNQQLRQQLVAQAQKLHQQRLPLHHLALLICHTYGLSLTFKFTFNRQYLQLLNLSSFPMCLS